MLCRGDCIPPLHEERWSSDSLNQIFIIQHHPIILFNSTRLRFNIHTFYLANVWNFDLQHLPTLAVFKHHLLCVQVLALIWIFTPGTLSKIQLSLTQHPSTSASPGQIKANLHQSKLLICLQETIFLVDHAICCKRNRCRAKRVAVVFALGF